MKTEFLNQIKELLGNELYNNYLNSLNQESKKAFRLNVSKINNINDTTSQSILDILKERCNAKENSVIDTAYHIATEDKLGNTWVHKAGAIYVQEPSSMMAVEALKRASDFCGARVLDMCASPGGKTSQLSEMVGKDGFVLSNEKNTKRVSILRQNVERLGLLNVAISCCDTSVLKNNLPNSFDAVLVDAPCSGEGMFRKDKNAQNEWSEGEVQKNSKLQLEILNNGARCVKNGGYLVYSTCTFNTHENEEVVLNFLKQNNNFEIIEIDEKIKKVSRDGIVLEGFESLKRARRFYPFDNFGEGQFVCVLKNTNCEEDCSCGINHKKKESYKKVEEFLFANFNLPKVNIKQIGRTYFIHNNNFLYLNNIPILTYGVAVCEIEKNVIKPHHNLFMAYGHLCRNKLNLLEEDERVQKFFKGEQIQGDCKDGFCCVCVNGFPVGFGKCKDGVINNHLPKGLRNS